MILNRLKQFIDFKGISVSAFEHSVGMSNASFGKSLKNNGAIGTDKLEKILNVYPEISPTWLLTGEGNMFIGNVSQSQNGSANILGDNSSCDKDVVTLLNRSFDELAEQRKLTESAQKQIDRLLTIIETLNQK